MAPTGIAIDRTLTPETLYVADETHGRILKFNAATGARLAVFGSTGFADGQFNRPYGIAIDPATRDLYIAERGNGRVQRITNNGAFVMKWGEHNSSPNTPQGFFNEPIGIAAAPDGHVYVVDKANNRIQKFHVTQSAGGWQVQNVALFGSSGSAPGQLNRPYGIVLENTGAAFWVADAGNHRIQRISIAGDPLRVVGSAGSAPGQFNLPTWIGIDPSGALYVTETNSDPQDPMAPDIHQQRVQRFRSTGDYDQFSWGGSFGAGPGEFRLPFCIAFGSQGRAFVSDYYNQRVQIFDLAMPSPSPPPAITSSPSATGTVGQPFSYQITADKQVDSYAATGLPAGVNANAATGLISGTPSAAGQTVATVSATNASGSGAASLTIDIVAADPAPGAWQSQDIGAVAAVGSASESGGVVTLRGSGADIWERADEFRFRHQTLTGDGEIVARVAALENTHGWAKAGVMLRETLAPGSPHVFMCLSAASGSSFQHRPVVGGESASTAGPWVGAPRWVRLVRNGTTFTGSVSTDGVSWTQVSTASVAMGAAVQAGLAVTSHQDGVLCTATFDNVTLRGATSNSAPPAPSGLTAAASSSTEVALGWTDNATNETGFQVERSIGGGAYVVVANTDANIASYSDSSVSAGTSYHYRVRATSGATTSEYSNVASVTTPTPSTPAETWQHADVGAVGIPGSDDAMGATITVRGSGADIWDHADGFRFLYQVLSGDCQIEARVSAVGATHSWAKAGVMIRESLAAGARNVFMCGTSGNGLSAQVRAATGGSTTSVRGPWGVEVPYWVRLVRTGSTIVASISADGIAWSTVSSVTMPISGDVYVGFAVTAHDNSQLNTSTFSDPAITPR